jgi:hypothetical protein
MSQVQTDGWFSLRDLTHQCAKCFWVLTMHRLAGCEFGRVAFPCAQHCDKYEQIEAKDGEF